MSMGVIARCPICEPLTYYAGKSGMEEIEGDVCELCAGSLNHYAIKHDGAHGTNYFPIKTAIVECKEHAKIWNAMLFGTPFKVVKEGCNFVLFRNPSIRLRAAGYLEEGK